MHRGRSIPFLLAFGVTLALAAAALFSGACSSSRGGSSDAGAEDHFVLVGPYLSYLSVTSREDAGATTPLKLSPAFTPEVRDYYVRCLAGDNPLTVTMTASTGATSQIVQPTTSAAAPHQTLHVHVNEGEALVAAARQGSESTQYWIRCLPHDFPVMALYPHTLAGTPTPGYYLVGTCNPKQGALWGYAIVLDSHGVPVWYVHGEPREGVEDVEGVIPGAVAFIPSLAYPYEVHYLDPLRTKSLLPKGTAPNNHELVVLPNGHYLVLANPIATGVDLTGLVITLGDGGTDNSFGKNGQVLDCDVVEFDPATGDVVWRWTGSEHFEPAKDSIVPGIYDKPGFDGGKVVDVFHCNSIDVDPENGNLLVSARDMDSIFYIDKKTGTILWKMGGNPYTKEHARYIKVDDPFYRQHDARLQPGWAADCAGGKGQISVFDDHSYEPGVARGVVYDVTVGDGDGGGGPGCEDHPAVAKLSWQFKGPGRSEVRGSFRITPDGSRVIGWGSNAAAGLVFTEVDEHGEDLADFYFSDGDVSYRAIKMPLSAFDLDVLHATAGMEAP